MTVRRVMTPAVTTKAPSNDYAIQPPPYSTGRPRLGLLVGPSAARPHIPSDDSRQAPVLTKQIGHFTGALQSASQIVLIIRLPHFS